MQRHCACKEPDLQHKRQLLRQVSQAKIDVTDSGTTIEIPVVVNIAFRTTQYRKYAAEVDWVIAELNKDFAKQASNFNTTGPYADADKKATYTDYIGRAANCKVVFKKQQVRYKPVGRQRSTNLNVLDRRIKRKSRAISPDTTLNLWVADISSGILGYAQFPWELKRKAKTDGVVITKGVFGRLATYQNYNLNKTLTHEVGHWMGLYHTFQNTFNYDGGNIDYRDGTAEEEVQEMKGDCVVDTPPQRDPTYGNPLANPSSWPTSRARDESKAYRHMYMNFMDYSNDIAMFMFTADQSIKLRLLTYLYRPKLVSTFTGATTPVAAVTTTTTTTTAKAQTVWSTRFENTDGWHIRPRFNRASNARLVEKAGQNDSNALVLRRRSHAITTLDLSTLPEGTRRVELEVDAKHMNGAFIYTRIPGRRRWRRNRLRHRGAEYATKRIRLRGRFVANYRIMLRSAPRRTYFDRIAVVAYTK